MAEQGVMDRASVSVTIRLWEHRMYRWMEVYQSGLGTSEAQLQVKQFSSHKYKSHRHIPDTVACALDTVQYMLWQTAKLTLS